MTRKVDSDASEHTGAGTSLSRWDARPFLERVATVAPSIIYVFNHKTQSNAYINRNIGTSLGYEPAELQAMGSEVMARIAHPDDLPRLMEYFARCLDMDDGDIATIEYRLQRKDGGWTWLLSKDTIFERDPDGTVVSHLGVATDITTQKEAEASLSRVNEELSELAYAITHDMKSPLNNIMGLCGLLEDMPEVQGDEAKELLSMIEQSCHQATEKIEDFFNVMQMSQLPTRVELIDLAQASADVRERLTITIDESDATFDEDFESAPHIRFSKVQFQSILENVVGNALKHRSPDRAPHIKLRSAPLPDGMTRVTVEDNGVGFDTERDGKRVFKLFQRVNQAVPGSGVGLYVVHQMMKRAGGSVMIRGELGQGTTVELRFDELRFAQ